MIFQKDRAFENLFKIIFYQDRTFFGKYYKIVFFQQDWTF